MKSHWESPTKGIGGGMALFWESLQSFRAEVTLSFSPAWIRGDEVGLWEEFKGFSAKASAWLLLQSAHSTAGHKLPEPGVRCWVCVCLERSIIINTMAELPCSAVSTFPPPKAGTGSAPCSRNLPLGKKVLSLMKCEHPTGKALQGACSSHCLTKRHEGTWVPPQNGCVSLHRWLPWSVQPWNEVKNLNGGG